MVRKRTITRGIFWNPITQKWRVNIASKSYGSYASLEDAIASAKKARELIGITEVKTKKEKEEEEIKNLLLKKETRQISYDEKKSLIKKIGKEGTGIYWSERDSKWVVRIQQKYFGIFINLEDAIETAKKIKKMIEEDKKFEVSKNKNIQPKDIKIPDNIVTDRQRKLYHLVSLLSSTKIS